MSKEITIALNRYEELIKTEQYYNIIIKVILESKLEEAVHKLLT